MRKGAAESAGIAALTAVLYAVGALLALRWFDANGLGPGFFPSAGVTVSVLVLTERRRWSWVLVAVAVTEFGLDIVHDLGPRAAAGYAVANVVEPLVGASLLRSVVGRVDLGRRRDLWGFLVCAGALGPAVGAVVAATTSTLDGGQRPWLLFAARWLLGDGLGVLLVGGAVLGWRSGDPSSRERLYRPTGVALLGVSVVASLAVFRWDVVWLGYVLVALLVTVAFRLGTRGVGIAGAGMATVIGEAAAAGQIDVPEGVTANAAWFALNLVVGLVVVVALALAVEIGEREESVRRRREAEEAQRTAEAQARVATERAALLQSEQQARARAELLQDVTARLSSLTAPAQIVTAIAELTARALATRTAILALPQADGLLRSAASYGYGDEERRRLDELLARGADIPLTAAFAGGGFVAASDRQALLARFAGAGDLPIEFGAMAAVACVVDGRPVGALGWGFDTEREFDEDFAAVASAIGAQSALALERGRLFEAERRQGEREHEVAVELQRALLGRPDAVAKLDVATVYRPGTRDLQVGGDWYDVIGLPDGAAALVIGDVTGHSLAAAAAMGQIRSTLRALAPLISEPHALLERLDTFVDQIDGATLTSLFYAVLDPATGALSYSCAGHPPPLLVPRCGEPAFLDGGHGPLLGVPGIGPRSTASAAVAADDTLVLYTDGLVERRTESLTHSLAALAGHAREACRSAGSSPALVCDHLTHALLAPDATDDTALLVARRGV